MSATARNAGRDDPILAAYPSHDDDPILDNWVWHALTGPHAHLAERRGHAVRYPRDVSPFAAVDEPADPQAWADLAELVGAARTAVLFRVGLGDPPPGWTTTRRDDARQMVQWAPGRLHTAPDRASWSGRPSAPDDEVARRSSDPGDGPAIRSLGEADVAAMLALVERSRPGPFLTRTVTLGSYLGVFDGPRLVAMAGERCRTSSWTEVSAVCTDPDYQGRGLAAALVQAVSAGIRAAGRRAMLHASADNTAAQRLYQRLGFVHRRPAVVLGVLAPPR